jgi:hypothetical protein
MQSNTLAKQRKPTAAEARYQKAMTVFLNSVAKREGASLAALGDKYRRVLDAAGVTIRKNKATGCTELDVRKPAGMDSKDLVRLANALEGRDGRKARRQERKSVPPIKRKIQHFEPMDDVSYDPRELGFD